MQLLEEECSEVVDCGLSVATKLEEGRNEGH